MEPDKTSAGSPDETPAPAPVELVDQSKDLTPTVPIPPDMVPAQNPPKISWTALGFEDDEMERFAAFSADNLQLVLDLLQVCH